MTETQLCTNDSYVIKGTPMRMNFWYVNIYGLWANIILNIISPLIGILVLNTIVYRKLNEHARNLNSVSDEVEVEQQTSRFSQRLKQERFLREREVTISIVNIYIGVLVIICHSVRIIPSLHEIISFLRQGTNEKEWPAWVRLVTTVSHLSLAISCSFNFYIYYFKYKEPKLRQKWPRLSAMTMTTTLAASEGTTRTLKDTTGTDTGTGSFSEVREPSP